MAERTYTIPLRHEWLKVPKYKRAKKAIIALRSFLARHMKIADDKIVRVGPFLNQAVWKRGIKNPPHHIKVHAKHDDLGVIAELDGKPYPTKQEKTEVKGLAGKIAETITGKKKEEKPVESKPVGALQSEAAMPTEPKKARPKKAPVKKEAPIPA